MAWHAWTAQHAYLAEVTGGHSGPWVFPSWDAEGQPHSVGPTTLAHYWAKYVRDAAGLVGTTFHDARHQRCGQERVGTSSCTLAPLL